MKKFSVVIDCESPSELAQFWAPALGYVDVGWPHEPYVVLVAPEGDRPHLLLQKVSEPKQGKNRVHIDIYSNDMEAEAKRLEELGATRAPDGQFAEHGVNWIVMADPEGNEFCVCDEGGDSSS